MIESTSFGNDRFLDLVGRCPDIDAHHGSLVGDYRSASFDVVGAVAENTRNVRAVMERMKVCGGRAFVLTGTVFEPGVRAKGLIRGALSRLTAFRRGFLRTSSGGMHGSSGCL